MAANQNDTLTIGVLAHVDAGKTTLSEAMLFAAGAIRRLGRVDHADAFLDTDKQERQRGITIFSKTARLRWQDREMVLLDTPGHVDFAAEAERTLTVLDAAVLIISGTDGVQAHTRTLWNLLERYRVPTFLFVNKMDLPGAEREARLSELRESLSADVADFSADEWMEQAAGESEAAMESYLNAGTIPPGEVRRIVKARKLFPCWFGAALRGEGVEALLSGLAAYGPSGEYPRETAARVFKVSRDPQGARLTWLKVTGGELRVREPIAGTLPDGSPWEEKLHQIRLYSGEKYSLAETAGAGTVCAVTGLSYPRPGDGLGAEKERREPVLEPVFSYRVDCPGLDPHTVLQNLRQLEEEDPLLRVLYLESLGEIRVQLMGAVQQEILERLCAERFGMELRFDEGSILYKETIKNKVEGVGHYEPLRHYAEVHLLLEPLPPGSGLQLASACSTDDLDLNWQRLILSHLREREHRGVLIGAPITDMRITLTAGRAHPKHTEGGDFREATFRALRQGLMQAESEILEPWYRVRLELPQGCVGRAMADLERMGGSFAPPETMGREAVLTGRAPVAEMGQYYREVAAYSRGEGRLFCTPGGYAPCRDRAGLIARSAYDPERDTDNPADSVFCSHGAGIVVPWREVAAHMHLEATLPRESAAAAEPSRPARSVSAGAALDKELQAIYERTYGKIKDRAFVPTRELRQPPRQPKAAPPLAGPEYVLLDGYNIIFAWEELKAVAEDHLDAARQLLMDLLCNYQALRQCRVILVFDAYRLPYHREEIIQYNNIFVVYTREAETADAYIEKTTHEIAREHPVRVVTSDGLEQLIVLGQGALRLSASAFRSEVEQMDRELAALLRDVNRHPRDTRLGDAIRASEEENAKEKT
ncbi:MAG: TetM/TetW/TetO/TetS family tetracycline resistance ribosomal protection protein [Oscillospiraceae bacterium]|nr:TetM/TetW/TetO/TetS family tetracycline resistance ribosomal protection protein [Oscillospiraceae bacterium]